MIRVRPASAQRASLLVQAVVLHASPYLLALEAVDDKEAVHAMAGLDNRTNNAADMHVLLCSRAGTRAIVRPAFVLAFEWLRLGLLHAHVRSDNAKSLSVTKTAGFREVYRTRDWHAPGVDDVLFEMRREECRFLGDTHAR